MPLWDDNGYRRLRDGLAWQGGFGGGYRGTKREITDQKHNCTNRENNLGTEPVRLRTSIRLTSATDFTASSVHNSVIRRLSRHCSQTCLSGRSATILSGREIAKRDFKEECISIFEKLRTAAKNSKFKTPSSEEAPSSKLKTDLLAVCPGIRSLCCGA